MATLLVSLLALGFGLFLLRTHFRILHSGRRAMARITDVRVGHGRHSSSSTLLSFSTTGGAPAECRVRGALGSLGQPRWVTYLPSDPGTCEADGGHALWGPLFYIVMGTGGLIASVTLYQRARSGDPLTRS